MTYALSWPLQEAVFQALQADAAVAALAGERIFDGAPQAGGAADDAPYVVIGDETVQDWSSADGPGADHMISISVYAAERSFAAAKRLAGAISDALGGGGLAPGRGRVVAVAFAGARTRREERDRVRRIDLRFRVLIEDTA